MKRILFILAIIVLALLLTSPVNAGVLQKRIIPADAEWVVHLDLEGFASSHFGEILLKGKGGEKLKKENSRFEKHFRIDLMKDIKGITFFRTGKEKEDTVLCLEGDFDRDYLLGLLAAESSHREIPHGNVTIHNWDGDEFGAFANDHLAVLSGSSDAIKTALDVIAGKRADVTSSSLKPFIEEVPKDAIFVALAKNLSSMTEHGPRVMIFKKINSAVFTASETEESLRLKLLSTVQTPEDAKNMQDVFKGLVALANIQLKETEVEMLLPEDIHVSAEGNTLRLELTYPSKELLKIIEGRVKLAAALENFLLP